MAGYDPASGTFSNKSFLSVADMTAFREGLLAAIAAGAPVGYSHLPASVQQLPLAFVQPGKPAAGALMHLVMVMATTIPADFAGSIAYAGTPAASSAGFTLNRLPAGGGAAVWLGTITFGAGASGATLSIQAAASLAAGDVLQLVAPSTQDAVLADIGITILAERT